jgi:lactoylglutathione lyase
MTRPDIQEGNNSFEAQKFGITHLALQEVKKKSMN